MFSFFVLILCNAGIHIMDIHIPSPSRNQFSLRYSMGAQIGAAMAVLVLFSSLLAFFFSSWWQQTSGRELMLAQARSIGLLVAAGSSDGVTFADKKLLARAAHGVEGLQDFSWLIIRNNNGDTLYTHNFAFAPEALQAGAQLMPLDSVRTFIERTGEVTVAAPIRTLLGNDRIGEVLIGLKPTVMNANIARSRIVSLVWGVILALFAGGISVVIAQMLTKPLRRLYHVTDRVSEGDLHIRAPEVHGIMAQSEPGVLTQAFNAMMNRLEDAQEEILTANKQLELTNDFVEAANAQLELRTMELSRANDQIQAQNFTLQELSKEKDEFLGIAAHDLKNPLTGIQGLSELLMSNLAAPENIPVIAKTIFQSSQKMFELIRNLLDVNALESGGQQFSLHRFSVHVILDNVVNMYDGRGKEKEISVHLEALPEPAMVYADTLAFGQIMDNIVSNAVKYSPRGKNVWVGAEYRTSYINAPEGKQELVLYVRDEGPGLSAEDQAKLFGKFMRLSARPTGGEHSTGLGLSIVKKMAEAMQGRVWCESELGKGATFLVALPSEA
ncbi:MAG: HAMP domain-containing protein [Candidatus Kapaibacterium sp.]|nr:MAG: HAMP domain-containing protein [Candidatus Kapabacteria bacterium]